MSFQNNLSKSLDALAANFASAVLNAIRSASIEDLIMETHGQPRSNGRAARTAILRPGLPGGFVGRGRGPAGRLPRRSPADIAKTLSSVQALLKSAKSGLRSEEIRQKLGLDKREVPRILKAGLQAKALKSKGQKRATTYFAV